MSFIVVVIAFCSLAAAYGVTAVGAEAAETLTYAQASKDVNCPECGYGNKADLNYCIKCGAPLKEKEPGAKYCTQCGAASPEGSKFCTACGYALQVKKPGVGAASAPPAHKIGIYFTGGLASYGGIEFKAEGVHQTEDMGTSWAVGGGFVLPVWSKPGMVPLSLELSTDAGFNSKKRDFNLYWLGKFVSRTSFLPIRETAVFGAGFGPSKMIKPFCGFGGGVGIVMWKYKTIIVHEEIISTGTTVKPLFDIPFGCEFHLTPRFALGVKADYLIIPGDIEMLWPGEYPVNASVPDVFLFGGVARFCF